MRLVTFLLIAMITLNLLAQSEKKILHINRVSIAPKIDAILNDAVWNDAEVAKDFVMFRPGSGNPEPENQKTIVKMCYDDEALYIGAYMYDSQPQKIPMQFSTRDNFSQVDFILISLNPFNDGINDLEFAVMSTGTQGDAKVSSNGEDFGWSAVWESETKIYDDGWCVEFKIPFSALRFSNENIQTWGMNIHRRMQGTKEQYSWNFIDKSEANFTEYSGLLKGIENINPPIRLSFYPYTQGSYTHFNGKNEWNGNAGMDVKYGINESFTLDATLIPDFGQTAFDDVVLNLGPFEQEYEEKRAFFTEGTELFAKGNLFYSRRVGSKPIAYDKAYQNLGEHEVVIENPEKTKLLNAIKITGRTKNGLGVGFFNAFTNTSEATIKNILTGEKRKIETSPFTNYNSIVLDQQFKNTSSVTLVNSNVWRNGYYVKANVTSFLTDLRVIKNKYSFNSDLSVSQKMHNNDDVVGFKGAMAFNKISGKHRFGASAELNDTKYDKNDFGIMYYNNYVTFNTKYSYQIFEPTKNFNSINFNTEIYYNRLLKPSVYTHNGLNANLWATTIKEFTFGSNISAHVNYEYDYHEPREAGRFYKNRHLQYISGWVSSDYRKVFAYDLRVSYFDQFVSILNENGFEFEFEPRYRFNNKFQMIYEFEMEKGFNNKGFVKRMENDDIIFGLRNYENFTNSLTGSYILSSKAAFNLSLRHYWAPVKYDAQFYKLNENGTLSENSYSGAHNINFNAWNLDFSYNWEFAPGSQLILLYRNSILNVDDQSYIGFQKNLDNLFEEPTAHQLSMRLIYYLDYNKLKF